MVAVLPAGFRANLCPSRCRLSNKFSRHWQNKPKNGTCGSPSKTATCAAIGSRGDWNIAQTPTAWEMMFHAVPSENVGIGMGTVPPDSEPHRSFAATAPMGHRKYSICTARMPRFVGRDSQSRHPRRRAVHLSPHARLWRHQLDGYYLHLRKGVFAASIDIEGWHDPVYRDELEMTGQVHALKYLKQCRGGAFVPNPF